MSDDQKIELKKELVTEIAAVAHIITRRTHRFAITFIFTAVGLTMCAGIFIWVSKDFILDYKKVSGHIEHCEAEVKKLQARVKHLEDQLKVTALN